MFAVDGGISLFKVLGTMDTMGTSGTRVVFLYLRCWGTMDTMGTMDTNRTSVVFLYVRTWGTMDIMGSGYHGYQGYHGYHGYHSLSIPLFLYFLSPVVIYSGSIKMGE